MPFRAAGFSLLAVLLAACGGGGGATAQSTAILPPSGNTFIPTSSSGPVAYMQTNGMSSSGTISKGTSSAIVAVMSGDASTTESYVPDTLTVSSSASSAASAVRRSMSVAAPSHAQRPEAFPADDSVLLAQLRQHAVAASPQPPQRVRDGIAANATIGSQMSVWVQQGGYASHTSVLVPATLVAQSTHGNIWVQSSLASGLSPNASQLAADFENAYASDTQNFASPDYPSNAPGLQPQYTSCSSAGAHQGTAGAYITEPSDKRIDVMVVDSSTLGGLGGYFSAANFMTQNALNCLNAGYESNQAPFIFVGWQGAYGSQYELQEDFVRSTAHELQHLINFVNHSLLPGAASNASFNGSESQYLNEGLSMLAQDYAVQRMYGASGVQFDAADALQRAHAYLANPSAFSISGFSGIDDPSWGGNGSGQANCSGGCYGGAYLFMRYLNDRFGATFVRAMETSGATGAANLQASTGEGASNLLGDFALSMAADTLGVTPSDSRFAFGTLNLQGSYKDQFGSTVTLGGLNAAPASGAATSVHAPLGGFAFVTIPSVPSGGMNVQVTDTASAGGFSLLGGLAQH